MKLSLTGRCLLAFLVLEVPFTLLASIASSRLFGITGYAITYTTLAIVTVSKMLAWSALIVQRLRPYEHLVRTPPSTWTPAAIVAADRNLQWMPLGFGSLYSTLWGLSYAVAFVVFWALGVDRLPMGYGVSHTGFLLATAIGLGAFGFAFPVSTWLTTEASTNCSIWAAERGVTLQRERTSLQFRIALLALGLGVAPTLWVMALGYQKQLDNGRLNAEASAELQAIQLAAASKGFGTPGRVAEAARGAGNVAFLVDAAARPVSDDGERAYAEFPELRGRVGSLVEATGPVLDAPLRGDSVVAVAPAAPNRVAVVRAPVTAMAAAFAVDAIPFALVIVIWAPLCAFILGQVVSGPIGRLTRASRFVVEEGKLTTMGTVPSARDDEVGQLTDDFNQVLTLMRSLSEAAMAVARGNLRTEVQGVGELPDAFREMLSNLTAIVVQIRETSVDLASAAAEIFAATQEQETAATAQSSAMIEISRTMESLSESAAHVSVAVDGVLSNAERTLQNTDDMVGRIGDLSGHANRIGEILEVIREIADRSDLLALNGSLEASRAGDAGRGFGLVANEMRRLAERVTDSVKNVKKLVSDIRESGSSTVLATEESRKLADGTTEAARQITFASRQQRTGTEQVSQSVRNVADMVTQAASATSQTRTAAEGLKSHADRLEEVVQRFELPAGVGGGA